MVWISEKPVGIDRVMNMAENGWLKWMAEMDGCFEPMD